MERKARRNKFLRRKIRVMRIRILVVVAAIAVVAGCTEMPEEHRGAAVDNDQNVLTGGPR